MLRPTGLPNASDVAAEERDAFERGSERLAALPDSPVGERLTSYYGALYNTPIVAERLGELALTHKAALDASGVPNAVMETVPLVISKVLGFDLLTHAHLARAVAAGVRLEALEALRAGRDDELDPEERELFTYITEVVGGSAGEASYRAIEARLGARATVELSAWICHVLGSTRLMQALGVEDMPHAAFDGLLAEYRVS
jgi:alkylhydroperoxidase family enzyme